MIDKIIIQPNRPLYVALTDPTADQYDFDRQEGTYQTTSGQSLVLPRPAVIALAEYGPAAGEEIRILKTWDGKATSQPTWTVTAAVEQMDVVEPAKPEPMQPAIEAPAKEPRPRESQPGLFGDDRATGTYGPAPVRAIRPAAGPRHPFERIPANVAVREILAFLQAEPNTQNWSSEARQDLASTIIIAAYKAGQIGIWER